MESYFSLYAKRVLSPFPSIPQDSTASLTDCFCINFVYSHQHVPYGFIPTSPNNITTDDSFTIPCEVLCYCNESTVLDKENHHINFLFNTFFSVPIHLLDMVLPSIGEYARQMVKEANNGEGVPNILEMDVKLDVITWSHDIGQNVQLVPVPSQIVDSLEKVEIGESSSSSSSSAKQCPICLEEFCNGSKSEVVRTNCLHVFHKKCIVQWIQRCIDHQSAYVCPLCRCQII